MRPPIYDHLGRGMRTGALGHILLQATASILLSDILEVGLVGLPDRNRSHLGTPMQKQRCLQPSKSALQPCRPWSTNIKQVAPGISELKSHCKRQMFHIEVRAILRASALLGLLASTVDLSNLQQKARRIKLSLLYPICIYSS